MDPQCELAEELFYSGKLHVLQWIHLTFCVLSVILCIFTAWKYVHKSLFESSTKELIIALYVLCIFHAGAFAIIQALHLISRYTASVPCDAQIPMVMPYYCLIAPLTLLILIRHGRFERNHALRGLISPSRSETVKDVYFLQLRDQWSHNLNFAAD